MPDNCGRFIYTLRAYGPLGAVSDYCGGEMNKKQSALALHLIHYYLIDLVRLHMEYIKIDEEFKLRESNGLLDNLSKPEIPYKAIKQEPYPAHLEARFRWIYEALYPVLYILEENNGGVAPYLNFLPLIKWLKDKASKIDMPSAYFSRSFGPTSICWCKGCPIAREEDVKKFPERYTHIPTAYCIQNNGINPAPSALFSSSGLLEDLKWAGKTPEQYKNEQEEAAAANRAKRCLNSSDMHNCGAVFQSGQCLYAAEKFEKVISDEPHEDPVESYKEWRISINRSEVGGEYGESTVDDIINKEKNVIGLYPDKFDATQSFEIKRGYLLDLYEPRYKALIKEYNDAKSCGYRADEEHAAAYAVGKAYRDDLKALIEENGKGFIK